MSYRLTQAAEDDLVNIYLDSIRLFGRAQAEHYYAGLHATFDFLGQNPNAARERRQIQPSARMHPHKSHLVFYQLEDQGILIIRIRHAHENWMNDLEAGG